MLDNLFIYFKVSLGSVSGGEVCRTKCCLETNGGVMSVFATVFVFCLGMFFLLGILVYEKPGEKALSALCALVLLSVATLYLAPKAFGRGHVASWTESFRHTFR